MLYNLSLFDKIKIQFLKYIKIGISISVILLTVSIVSLAFKGLNLGLDFTGGSMVELKYSKTQNTIEMKELLEKAGYQDMELQSLGDGSRVLIKFKSNKDNDKFIDEFFAFMKSKDNDVVLERAGYVGAKVGKSLIEKGGLGLVLALLLMMLYITMRFQVKFALGCLIALVHDVIVVLGLFSLIGLEFDLTVLAAVLAIIGYSLNDTIVVYDRVRDNLINIRANEAKDVINISLQEIFGRTIITSLTTLLAVIVILIFSSTIVYNFALAMLMGVIFGTYSSIYVACSVLLFLRVKREELILSEKEKNRA